MKDRLKARGYRWNGDDAVPSRCWYVDVAEADKEAELVFLRQEIYGGEIDRWFAGSTLTTGSPSAAEPISFGGFLLQLVRLYVLI
jgi:hypothetical protein